TSQVIAIRPARAVTADCTAAATARLDGAFQQATATVDANGSFSFPHVLGFDADITCLDASGKMTERFTYFAESDTVSPRSPQRDCVPIDVVDPSGRPVAGAVVVSSAYPPSMVFADKTDARGRSCIVTKASDIDISPPAALGGGCAAPEHRRLPLMMPRGASATPLRVTIHPPDLERVAWRGRVLSPERLPVAGAKITVPSLRADAIAGCTTEINEHVETRLDGTFTLPKLARGDVTLQIGHAWYVAHTVQIRNTGVEQDFVMSRGATWVGRVLD